MSLADDARVIEAATPGQWYWSKNPNGQKVLVSHGLHIVNNVILRCVKGRGGIEADQAFIARARTRYPALVAEVRDLKAVNAALLEALLEFERVLRTDSACVTGWDQFQRAIMLMGKALKLCRVNQEEA